MGTGALDWRGYDAAANLEAQPGLSVTWYRGGEGSLGARRPARPRCALKHRAHQPRVAFAGALPETAAVWVFRADPGANT